MHDLDYDRFISVAAKRWQPSGIRGLLPFENIPGMISLLAGKPNPATFPFQSITIDLKSDVLQDNQDMPRQITISQHDLEEGLQYGPTSGVPRLVKWIETFQTQVHQRQHVTEERWRCSMGAGSQELLCKAFSTLCNPGDTLLVESPSYPGAIGVIRQAGIEMVGIPCDISGISHVELQTTLLHWHTNPSTHSLSFPKVLYTVPVGSNPGGSSASTETKIKVLQICRRFNLLIIEDDPYFHIHYNKPERAPSYFQLEADSTFLQPDQVLDGRVVRLDTFSKILSSGMRLGFVTGPKVIVDYIDLQTSNTSLHPSSLIQVIIYELLHQWGIQGFLNHTDRVASFYKCQLDMTSKAASQYLTNLAEWETPVAGMFLWIKLLISNNDNDGDSKTLIAKRALEKGVLAVPGFACMPNLTTSPYVRTSFSLLKNEEEANEAFKRLASVVLEFRHENGLHVPSK